MEVNPALAEAYNNMGHVMKAKGDRDAAIEHYRKASDVASVANFLSCVLPERRQANPLTRRSPRPQSRVAPLPSCTTLPT